MPMSPNASRISRQRCGGDAAFAMALAQRRHHALAHFRRGLAREGDRQDVARRDARLEQAHVAIDEHARLAGAGRGLERDVAQRIDRQPPRPRVRRLLRLERGVELEPHLLRHFDLSLLSLLWPSAHSAALASAPSVGPARMTAHRRERAHRAEVLGLGPRRVVAGGNGVERRDQPMPADGRQLVEASCRALRAAPPPAGPSNDRYIASLAGMSRPCVGRQRRAHAGAVDRQLQRQLAIGHVLGLVVDQPERAVAQQIDAIDLRAQADVADAPSSPVNVKAPSSSYSISRSRMLDAALRFHREHAIDDARADRGSEQPRALEPGFGGRQRSQRRPGDLFEQRAGLGHVARR